MNVASRVQRGLNKQNGILQHSCLRIHSDHPQICTSQWHVSFKKQEWWTFKMLINVCEKRNYNRNTCHWANLALMPWFLLLGNALAIGGLIDLLHGVLGRILSYERLRNAEYDRFTWSSPVSSLHATILCSIPKIGEWLANREYEGQNCAPKRRTRPTFSVQFHEPNYTWCATDSRFMLLVSNFRQVHLSFICVI